MIDGTTNFSAGIHSLTCVSIGYCENGRPVVGVIYVPGTKELYLAVKGYGAYRNGTRIWQSPDTSTKTLQTAVVCCEFGYAREKEHVDRILVGLSKIMQSRCRAIRQLGSGCLDLCLVASGRLDVVYAGLANEGWKVSDVDWLLHS
jgi:myo-inositol-1(or 4)-monophosphatase